MVKTFIQFFVILFLSALVSSTLASDRNKIRMDSAQVVGLLLEKKLILITPSITQEIINEYPSLAPKVNWDAGRKIWTVESVSYGQTVYKRKCAKVNGCTPETKLIVKVKDKTGKIVSKRRITKWYPNYE